MSLGLVVVGDARGAGENRGHAHLVEVSAFDSVETQVHQLGGTPFASARAEVPFAAG